MDNFEALIRLLLENGEYWTRQSHKVELTKEEKRKIGKPSMPRPEIDLLAFHHRRNNVLLMEVKSHLDSPGVQLRELEAKHDVPEGRYKLFTCKPYFEAVIRQLKVELVERELIDEDTTFTLGLAAGKICQRQDDKMVELFNKNGWELWTPDMIWKKTEELARIGYENDPFVLTAKVLVRGNQRNKNEPKS